MCIRDRSSDFYTFVGILCVVYVLCALVTSGMNVATSGGGVKDYLRFIKQQCLPVEMCIRDRFVTGNTVIDALKTTVRTDYSFSTQALNGLDYTGKRIILVTCHRREDVYKRQSLGRVKRDMTATSVIG